MTNYQANRIRNLINGMALLLETETDPAKRLELKNGIRAAEFKLTSG